jgi:hypothetical protein
VTQFQRAAWLTVVLVSLTAFGLVIPQLPAWGDESIALTVDTQVGMATASVAIPAGWDLDIAASSQQTPVASRSGVEVTMTDAVWLGDTADLLANVADLLFAGAAVIPAAAAQSGAGSDGAATREVWQLTPTAAASQAAPVRVDVIRSGEGVVLVTARGTAGDVTALSDAIDAISDSVQLELSAFDIQADV